MLAQDLWLTVDDPQTTAILKSANETGTVVKIGFMEAEGYQPRGCGESGERMIVIILYHPNLNRIELWDESDRPYTAEDRYLCRNVWRHLEYALEMGWQVVGTL